MVSIVAFELQRLQWNSYFDPKTGLLKNQVNATTQEELDQEEVRAATIMETVMKSNPPKNTGDLAELLEIYRQLFSHVYPWAGKIRIVNLSKQVDAKHAFTDVSHIEQEMREEAARLRNDNLLQDLDENRFIEKNDLAFCDGESYSSISRREWAHATTVLDSDCARGRSSA